MKKPPQASRVLHENYPGFASTSITFHPELEEVAATVAAAQNLPSVTRDREDTITVVIPTIPPRQALLQRALKSVYNQTSAVDSIITRSDLHHEGAWVNRQRAAASVNTKWIAFLDDDDELLPNHIELLIAAAHEHEADMTWGWFNVIGGIDPWPHYRGRQYDPAQPHVVPITYLVKTDLFQGSGGFKDDPNHFGAWDIQDQPVIDNIFNAGGKLLAIEHTTWLWHHDSSNTSGVPSRWK